MDIELAFITKIIEEENMSKVLDNRIDANFFYGKGKPLFKFIMRYYREYSKPPSFEAVKREFGSFEKEEADEPLDYFIDELRKRHKHNVIVEGVNQIADYLETEELDEAETELFRLTSKVTTELKVARDLHYIDDIEDRIERYLYKKEHQGIDGIPTGITPLDNETGGAHGGELITILAQPGTGNDLPNVA